MSIHPVHAFAILQKSKQVEFRKRPVCSDVSHILIYATQPIGAIVGAFAIVDQCTSHPNRLWDDFHEIGGISRDLFDTYYGEKESGTGIRIGQVYAMPDFVSLEDYFGWKRPPQSYQYADHSKAVDILEMAFKFPVLMDGLEVN